jgi:hypothetical protein
MIGRGRVYKGAAVISSSASVIFYAALAISRAAAVTSSSASVIFYVVPSISRAVSVIFTAAGIIFRSTAVKLRGAGVLAPGTDRR